MLQVNAVFDCDLLTTDFKKQVSEAIKTLATSDITRTCNDTSVMVTCDDLLAMATRNNHCIKMYERLLESL